MSDVLPVPEGPIAPSALRRFKEQHGRELMDFRLRVERELIAIAALPDDDLRNRQTSLFLAEAADKTAELTDAMKGQGWRTTLAKVATLAAAIPGAPQVLGLLSAAKEVLRPLRHQRDLADFAYAAEVKANLGKGRRIG